MLASAYNVLGRSDEAVRSEQQALELAVQQHSRELQKYLRGNLEHYERDARLHSQ
jgi:hypothetical protein